MARHFAWILAVALPGGVGALWLSQVRAAGHGLAQQRPSRRRMHETAADSRIRTAGSGGSNPESRKEIGITDPQSAQIDRSSKPCSRPCAMKWRELEKLEPAVAKLLKERVADVTTVTQQVERVEKLDAERRTAPSCSTA